MFVTLQADCTKDTLETILRDAGYESYPHTVQPGAFATVIIAEEDIARIRGLLDRRGIEHGV